MAFQTLNPTVASAELAPSEGEIAAVSFGYAGATIPQASAVTSTFQPTSGVAYFFKARFEQQGTPSLVNTVVTTAGATLTASDNLVGIYDLTGTLLATSADLSVAWASTGLATAAITYAAGLVEGKSYYFALLAVGTTTPIFAADGTVSAPAKRGASASTARPAFSSGSSLTALPATVTIASGTDVAKTILIGVS